MNTVLFLLSACASDQRREGHWQGLCAADHAEWAATVSLDLGAEDGTTSSGSATVDRGYGSERGTARLVEDEEREAVVVVQGDEEPWQMWLDLTYGWDGAGDDTWRGYCHLSPDETFEVVTDCSDVEWIGGFFPWATCETDDVQWSGSEEGMRPFMDSVLNETTDGTTILLTREGGALSGAVPPEDTGATEDTDDSGTTPTIDPDDYVVFSLYSSERCTSETAEARDVGGALTLACGEPNNYGTGARFTFTAPGVGTFDACDAGVSLTIDYGSSTEVSSCYLQEAAPLEAEITERTEDAVGGTALWEGHVSWTTIWGGTVTGDFRVPVRME